MKQLLKDVAEIAAGQGAPQGNENYCSNGTPFVKAGNLLELLEGKSIYEIQQVSDEVAKKHRLKLYGKGTILFAKSGMSCLKGYIYILPCDAYVVSHLACVTPKCNISDYLQFYFNYYKPNQLVKDTSYPSISLSDIGNLEIDLKDETQRANIVNILKQTKKLIDARQQQLQKLDDLVKARFVEMFGNPASNEKQWKIKNLETVTTIVTYGLTVRPNYIDEGIDLVSAKELHKGFVDYEDAPKISEEDFKKLSEKGKPQINDILFSKTGSIGYCALVEHEKQFAITQNAARIGLKTELVNPLWILYYLRTDFIQNWCKGHAKGNAVKDFQLQDMKAIPLFDCPIELQNQYVDFVKQVKRSKFYIQKALDKNQLLFNSLMQQYFG